MGTVTWQREAWEQRVAVAGLRPGVMVTALALSLLADDEGLAVPGVARLAEISHCSRDTAHRRLKLLEAKGFAERQGRVSGVLPRRAVIRWQLTVPYDEDVGQRGGSWS